jgi:hypothetical protein
MKNHAGKSTGKAKTGPIFRKSCPAYTLPAIPGLLFQNLFWSSSRQTSVTPRDEILLFPGLLL